jgi:type IV pilus assembly protein PilV
MAALQATSLRNSQSALERSEAVVQSYAILDAMRANLDVARINGYNLSTMTCTAPNAGTGSGGTALAATDLHDWILGLQATLGESSCGQIACGSTSCRITVQWDDSRGTHATADTAPITMVTETRL